MLTVALIATLILAAAAQARGPKIATRIAETQVALWRCQDQLSLERTRASVSPWALPRSPRYRAWVLELWQRRHAACARVLTEVKRQWQYERWMPAVWVRLAECESGSKPPNWQHDSGTYTGGFGFHIDSWRHYKAAGDPDRASQASPWAQYQAALRIHARFGFSGWGCYQGAAHAWVRG